MNILKKLFWAWVFLMCLRFAIGGPIALVFGFLNLTGLREGYIIPHAILIGIIYTFFGGWGCLWSGRKLFEKSGKATPIPEPVQAQASPPSPQPVQKIAVVCPHCDANYSVDPKFAGKAGRCKKCGGAVVVPDRELGAFEREMEA